MTTRKFPRTLQEAFGPHTSRVIEEAYPPIDTADRIVLSGCFVAAIFMAVLVYAGVV